MTGPWHRSAAFGAESWADGQLHLDWLIGHGLEPGHRLLELGCGPLRAGIHLIDYLDEGCYVGVDNDARLLAAASSHELTAPLKARRPSLQRSDTFGVLELDTGRFDVIWAYSVATHLDQERLGLLFASIAHHLTPDGRAWVSYNQSTTGEVQTSGPHPARDEIYHVRYPEGVVRAQVHEARLCVLGSHPAFHPLYAERPHDQVLLELCPAVLLF